MLTIKTTDVRHKIWFHQLQHIRKKYKVFKLQKSLRISEPLKESSHGREYSKLYNLWSLYSYLNLTFLLVFFVFFLHKTGSWQKCQFLPVAVWVWGNTCMWNWFTVLQVTTTALYLCVCVCESKLIHQEQDQKGTNF